MVAGLWFIEFLFFNYVPPAVYQRQTQLFERATGFSRLFLHHLNHVTDLHPEVGISGEVGQVSIPHVEFLGLCRESMRDNERPLPD